MTGWEVCDCVWAPVTNTWDMLPHLLSPSLPVWALGALPPPPQGSVGTPVFGMRSSLLLWICVFRMRAGLPLWFYVFGMSSSLLLWFYLFRMRAGLPLWFYVFGMRASLLLWFYVFRMRAGLPLGFYVAPVEKLLALACMTRIVIRTQPTLQAHGRQVEVMTLGESPSAMEVLCNQTLGQAFICTRWNQPNHQKGSWEYF